MSTPNELFIEATRKKIRFETNRGLFSVEELWDLNLTTLDNLAITVDNALQKSNGKSFIGKKPRGNAENELKLEILKFVIETKQREDEESKTRAERQQRRAEIDELITRKKMEQLAGKSLEELEALRGEV